MIFVIFCYLLCISITYANNDFIINNSQCRMPNFPAFSEETETIYFALPYVNCTDLDLLTYTSIKNNTAYLHLRDEYLDQYYGAEDSIDCCYSYVRRNGTQNEPDVGISISSCESFNSTVQLEEDTVMVKCFLGADKIYHNVHRTLTISEKVEAKIKKLEEISKVINKRPLSVLIMVVDGVSRLNFERTMPLTKEFLIENQFVELMGYNKIDDNTYPNFNALLTGFNVKQSNSICKPAVVGQLDKCPMIWYDFRDFGYATAYAEDWAEISTYNYLKKGFKNPPTDYYFKPYMESVKTLGTMDVDSMPHCAGPESQGERILNLARNFSTTFKNYASFGIFWMNTFSHNYINTPSRMDVKFKSFFEDLKKEGVLDESMVVVLADHGVRFGKIRQTIQGWYEERLPTNFIYLPPWFKEENPEKYENLRNNAQKLTSTFDLYMTLQDVLSSSVENYTVINSQACPNCQSLFSEIPDKRSCGYAGIPETWCTCIGLFRKNHTDLTPEMNKAALKFIMESNKLTSPEISVNKIVVSGITYHQRRAYVFIVFETDDSYAYQVLLRANIKPLRFVKVIQTIRLWKVMH